jgi:hypothetical protein
LKEDCIGQTLKILGQMKKKTARKPFRGEPKTQEQTLRERTSKKICELVWAGSLRKVCDTLFNDKSYSRQESCNYNIPLGKDS